MAFILTWIFLLILTLTLTLLDLCHHIAIDFQCFIHLNLALYYGVYFDLQIDLEHDLDLDHGLELKVYLLFENHLVLGIEHN